jgi:hypothetical protein
LTKTREEHIEWCKKRAIIEMDFTGEPSQGIISMMSDLRKHPETENHSGIQLATGLMMMGQLKTRQEVINFINGFN